MQRLLKTIYFPISYTELLLEENGESDRARMFRWSHRLWSSRGAHTGSLAPRSGQVLLWGLADPSK